MLGARRSGYALLRSLTAPGTAPSSWDLLPPPPLAFLTARAGLACLQEAQGCSYATSAADEATDPHVLRPRQPHQVSRSLVEAEIASKKAFKNFEGPYRDRRSRSADTRRHKPQEERLRGSAAGEARTAVKFPRILAAWELEWEAAGTRASRASHSLYEWHPYPAELSEGEQPAPHASEAVLRDEAGPQGIAQEILERAERMAGLSGRLRPADPGLPATQHRGELPEWPRTKAPGVAIQEHRRRISQRPGPKVPERSSPQVPAAAVDPSQQILEDLSTKFKEVAQGLDVDRAHSLLRQYWALGGTQRLLFTSRLINMYGRQRNIQACLKLYEMGKEQLTGQPSDVQLYGAVITACARAQHPPYMLPPEYAQMAREVMNAALAAGLTPHKHVWASLMDAQAKAGFVEEAFATLAEMQRPPQLIKPDHFVCNTLVNACSRSSPPRPAEAMRVVEEIMPRYKLVPDRVTWNTLINCHGKAGDMDGAYRIWQQMQKSGIVPNRITEFNLASAFAPCPSLAADLVAEARALREELLQGPHVAGQGKDWQRVERDRAKHPQHLQQRPLQLDGRLDDAPMGAELWLLDLHNMSASASRMSLLRRLDSVTEHVVAHGLPEQVHGRPFQGLEIVTGKGNHSIESRGGVLKRVAEEVLDSKGLHFLGSGSGRGGVTNEGLLLVPPEALDIWARQQHQSTRRSAFVHQMSLRYMSLVGIVGTAMAAAYIVPKILQHA